MKGGVDSLVTVEGGGAAYSCACMQGELALMAEEQDIRLEEPEAECGNTGCRPQENVQGVAELTAWKGYNYVRGRNLLKLPCQSTLQVRQIFYRRDWHNKTNKETARSGKTKLAVQKVIHNAASLFANVTREKSNF